MSFIISTVTDGVMHVQFNRPERKNALTDAMYLSLAEAVDDASQRTDVKALVFSGSQGVFTAGNDLDSFVSNPPSTIDAPVFAFLRKIAAFEKPALAAVEGLAIGVGTTMLLHCDLVYAGENARFALPFVPLGLSPEAASSLLLARVAGHQKASEKLLFGDTFSIEEADRLGFITKVLPAHEVLEYTLAQARRLVTLPQGSIAATKSLMKSAAGSGQTLSHLENEVTVFAERLQGPALKEAVKAFAEKRKPVFSGMH
ncbi:enoyl-CoA hydratase [Pseudomonas aeruginosa]|nr:enoyl-CoA hydratase [Pseudomonas aeruginosa]